MNPLTETSSSSSIDFSEAPILLKGIPPDSGPLDFPEIRHAQIIAGGKRLLALLPQDLHAQLIPLEANLKDTLKNLLRHLSPGRHLLILASGDPLFHGIASTVLAMANPEHVRIDPAPTAFQTAFARLKLPWSATRFFSVHGTDKILNARAVLTAPGAVVYGDPHRSASVLAKELVDAFPDAGQREAFLAEDLGLPSENLQADTLKNLSELPACSGLSMLILPEQGTGFSPALALGLPDETYHHQNHMITHPETRVLVLSKLRLRRGVLWDLGAGSGSVGLEAASLCEALEVHSVEKNPERCKDILQNIREAGLSNIHLHSGRMEDLWETLPAPDSVFFGGGGPEALSDLLPQTFRRLNPGGVLAATAILMETEQCLNAMPNRLQDLERAEFLTVNIARTEKLGPSGHMRKAENPVFLAVFHKKMFPGNGEKQHV